MRKTILLVDDDPVVLSVLDILLQADFDTLLAHSGRQALQLARQQPGPELILLDLELPDMSGFEVCAELKRGAATADIPVMFLSGHDDVDSVTHGFAAGGVDFVGKPVVPPILMARIETQLRLRDANIALADQNRSLEDLVARRTLALMKRTEELLLNQELMIVSLGSIAETRDNETGYHIQRTRAYIEILTRSMPESELQKAGYPPDQIDIIWKSAPLHDIGKVGIPDHILQKPGRLSAAEFEIMKQHTTLGHNAIRCAEQRVHATTSILQTSALIAMHHHERWDGSGYPCRLAGADIPLPARLMAVADAYDAMTSNRVYQNARSHDDAVAIIRDERLRHFDPGVVDCFLDCCPAFTAVQKNLDDNQQPGQLRLAPAPEEMACC